MEDPTKSFLRSTFLAIAYFVFLRSRRSKLSCLFHLRGAEHPPLHFSQKNLLTRFSLHTQPSAGSHTELGVLQSPQKTHLIGYGPFDGVSGGCGRLWPHSEPHCLCLFGLVSPRCKRLCAWAPDLHSMSSDIALVKTSSLFAHGYSHNSCAIQFTTSLSGVFRALIGIHTQPVALGAFVASLTGSAILLSRACEIQ